MALAIDSRLRFARSVMEREAFLAAARETLIIPSGATMEEGLVGLLLSFALGSFSSQTFHKNVLELAWN